MTISERLDKIAEDVRSTRSELRRLMADLPVGATLDVTESVECRASKIIDLLKEEAAYLRVQGLLRG